MINNNKHIQFPRYKLDKYKKDAIEIMNQYIQEHPNEFIDGEEIVLKYKDINDNWCTSNAIIDNNILNIAITEKDTLKIIESTNPPVDKETLWLTEWSNGGDPTLKASDLQTEVKLLKEQLKKMQETLNKHDYALSNTIAGGDIIVNSEKYNRENETETEQPEDSDFKPNYDTEDTKLDSWDIYLGNSCFKDLINDNYEFYIKMKYYIKFKVFNKKKNEIDPSPYSIELTCTSSIATINEHVLLAENEGTAIIHAKLLYNNNEVDNKVYNIMFLNNAKPDYETYGEPNVHHLLVKTAKTYEELLNNFNYLCVNELCWCIENNSLYIKIKASNGSLVLFKINGDSASEIPITFKYNDGYVEIDDNNKELVYVDSDGYINILPSTIDEDGYIILNDIATNN